MSNSTPGLFERDPGGVGNAPRPDHDVATLDLVLAGGCAGGKADPVSLSAVNIESFGRYQNLNSFVAQDPLHFLGDVAILAGHQLRPGLDDRHAADGSRFFRTWHAIQSSRLPKWFLGCSTAASRSAFSFATFSR